MGKWDRRYYRPRPRRRNCQDYDWSPPRNEPCPDPETEDWQDNVPMWEKKFCYLVGRMPWKKVLSTKNFMHCHSSILGWDDSAGKEAFDNAKRRFWEDINSLPSLAELPNADMYIDEIDWNPHIDPELVRDLDRAYFNPDDKYYLPSENRFKGNNGWPDDTINPWERAQVQTSAVKDKETGWNQWDNWPGDENHQDHVQISAVKDKVTGWGQWDSQTDDENGWGRGKARSWKQWESSVNPSGDFIRNDKPWGPHTNDSEVVRDGSWGGAGHKSWDVNPPNHSDVSKNWNVGGPNSRRNEGSSHWQVHGPSSRNWNQKASEFHKPNNSHNNYRQQDYGSYQRNRGPNGRGNSWGQKRWDNSNNSNHNNNWEVKESGNIPRGRGQFSAVCRKREGPDHYTVNQKGPRLQGGEPHSSRYWNGGNNKRTTSGGQWS